MSPHHKVDYYNCTPRENVEPSRHDCQMQRNLRIYPLSADPIIRVWLQIIHKIQHGCAIKSIVNHLKIQVFHYFFFFCFLTGEHIYANLKPPDWKYLHRLLAFASSRFSPGSSCSVHKFYNSRLLGPRHAISTDNKLSLPKMQLSSIACRVRSSQKSLL